MILGGNQPYFIPYLGYFQLIKAVDVFLIGDDFQYINKGWVNRNRIIINRTPGYLSLPITHTSSLAQINELKVLPYTDKIIRIVRYNYASTNYFKRVFPLFEDILSFPNRNLSAFLFNSLQVICNYLEITTPLLLNSDRKDDTMLRGEERVIHLCHAMGADTCINAIGGQKLYSREHFAAEGINLKFLQSELPPYRQLHTQQFVPGLSILDIMMNVPVEEIRKMLDRYTLI